MPDLIMFVLWMSSVAVAYLLGSMTAWVVSEKSTLRASIRLICRDCAENNAVFQASIHGERRWAHQDAAGKRRVCPAHAIHDRMAGTG